MRANYWSPYGKKRNRVIDSSTTNIHQLRRQVWECVDREADELTVILQSFAYKRGIPQDVDFAFDTRMLPNPHWQDELQTLTGQDEAVRNWLKKDPDVLKMTRDIESFMHDWLPTFKDGQRSYVTIGIGCTGGQHRSVYLAETLANAFRKTHRNVLVHHRELNSRALS